MILILYLFFLGLGILFLIKATDQAIKLIEVLGLKTKIPVFLVSLVFLAMATSFPEFFVGLISAIKQEPLLSLGNVFGSNLLDMTLILGVTALISGGVRTGEKIISKDILVTAFLGFIPCLLIFDGSLSFADGLVLVLAYVFYIFYNILLYGEEKRELRLTGQQTKGNGRLIVEFLLWLLVLAGSAQIVVTSSEAIAKVAGLPLFFIGFFLIAFGTTLPELIVELRAAEKRESGIFFGNILGSVAINSTLILGIVAMISPVAIGDPKKLFVYAGFLFLAFFILPFLLRSKKKLERWEGMVLVAIYLIFVLVEYFGKVIE